MSQWRFCCRGRSANFFAENYRKYLHDIMQHVTVFLVKQLSKFIGGQHGNDNSRFIRSSFNSGSIRANSI